MKLYSFFNSSASYAVRIALNLKGLAYDIVPVNIRAGEQRAPDFLGEVSASPAVPALVDGGVNLSQSLAIIDWLEATYPSVVLIPHDKTKRARVLEITYAISSDIRPVNNLRILKYLQTELGLSDTQKGAWYKHWIAEGMEVVERLLQASADLYCVGDAPTLADCCLIPQIAGALRMGCDMTPYAKSMEVYDRAMQTDAFARARPDAQPDFLSP
ncbi:maleylacetoacetate isomerase [Paraburkholderia fungorum]|uniref:maleylacetoacetate isomerase n=1 Tax=Paraburkholderia fungorum TaxID=134537 RepID=UPI001C1EB605|nr:maleylacetoacetate isomerase [Paraburkholderia fungorum]MBU7443532.1 maleylacetoacetate isomerase [Paraburkholderia fungorum]